MMITICVTHLHTSINTEYAVKSACHHVKENEEKQISANNKREKRYLLATGVVMHQLPKPSIFRLHERETA